MGDVFLFRFMFTALAIVSVVTQSVVGALVLVACTIAQAARL